MKKILIFAMLLTSFCFANLYDKPTSIKDISKNLPQLKNIKCKFKQEKYIKNISKPLISNGDFEFIENKGVYFYTKYPIESTTDYTNSKYKQINDIISAISNNKYSKLEHEFDFYYEGDISNWSFGLKPKNKSDCSKFILTIEIEGSDYIKKITINQTNGNKTTLWFAK